MTVKTSFVQLTSNNPRNRFILYGLYLTHLWSDFKKSGAVEFGDFFLRLIAWNWRGFCNPNFWGFGVPPFGVPHSWGLQTTKRHSFNLSAINWCYLRAFRLFGVGCTRFTGGSPSKMRKNPLFRTPLDGEEKSGIPPPPPKHVWKAS